MGTGLPSGFNPANSCRCIGREGEGRRDVTEFGTRSTYLEYVSRMNRETSSLARDYGMVVDDTGRVPALEAVGDGPLTVLNLFALEALARYEDGTTCPGLEAMLRYSAVSGKRLEAVGGSFVAQAIPTGVVWGEDDRWDVLVVASYPSANSFWSLLADARYREAFVHRRAAVSRQRVTVGVPLL